MNSIEKIIAQHAGESAVRPGQIVQVAVDWVMTNDATTALTYDIFRTQLGGETFRDGDKVVMVIDHYLPCNSVASAEYHRRMRRMADEQNLTHVYEGEGICHQVMMENHVRPGQLIVGADSHTCSYGALGAAATGMGSTDIAVIWRQGTTWLKVPETIRIELVGTLPPAVDAKDVILMVLGQLTARGATYKAVEFTGEAVAAMSVAQRTTLCNMVVEAGGKFAYVQPDATTDAWLRARGRDCAGAVRPDDDAEYEQTLSWDISALAPQVARPHSVDRVGPVTDVAGLPVDELFLGACTNGRLEDLQIAATILDGRSVAPGVRLLVTPASRQVYRDALTAGLIDTFLAAGAIVNHPGCSACFGATQGLLAPGERLLSTANRNFRGRVGSPDAEIYLASPATVAASAITGVITDPREVV